MYNTNYNEINVIVEKIRKKKGKNTTLYWCGNIDKVTYKTVLNKAFCS